MLWYCGPTMENNVYHFKKYRDNLQLAPHGAIDLSTHHLSV